MNVRSEWLGIYRSWYNWRAGRSDGICSDYLSSENEWSSRVYFLTTKIFSTNFSVKTCMPRKVLLYTCTHYNRCPSGLITTYNGLLGEPESTHLSQVNSLEYIWRVSEGREFFKDWVNLNVRYHFCQRSQNIHCSFVRSWDTRLQTPVVEVDLFMLWIPWPIRQL